MAWFVAICCGCAAVFVPLLVSLRWRRRELRRALRLRSAVRPYLLHRAIEAGLAPPVPSHPTANGLVDELCALTDALREHEHRELNGDAIAITDTMPVEEVSLTRRTKPPLADDSSASPPPRPEKRQR
ncbi:MAG: hypothetical protein H6707_07790 [Deltaproteobacteria bacterium]|nr:hypothetical protein [Deltaproteobacteria bacterium]